MHKFQPRIHLVASPGGREAAAFSAERLAAEMGDPTKGRGEETARRTFSFPETAFMAVTAYQNQLVRFFFTPALRLSFWNAQALF